MTSPQPPQLDYGPPLRPLQRRWVRRWIIRLAMLFLIVEAGWWGPALWHKGILCYWQHECLVYTAPADRIVYESDPTAAAALLQSGNDYERLKIGWPANAFAVGARCPKCWDRLDNIAMGNQRAAPPHTSTSTCGGCITLFLHERRSRHGVVRLVVIDCYFLETPQMDEIDPLCESYEISLSDGVRIPDFQLPTGLEELQPDPRHPMRIFAGQPDPADASHFTIAYERDHKKGTIDGWLRDDDTVKLELQHDSTTKP